MSAKRSAKLFHAAMAAAPAVGLIAGTLAITQRALATQYVYTPAGTTDNWSGGANWSPGAPASAIDAILTYVNPTATVLTAGQTSISNNDFVGAFSLNELDLQGTGAAAAPPAIIVIGGNALSFTNNGTADPTINLNASAGTGGLIYTINTAFQLPNTLTFGGTGNATFSFNGNISGPGGLVFNNTNTVALTGTNTYGGSTTITAGTVRFGQAAALGSLNTPGQTIVNGGTLAVSAGGSGFTSAQLDTLLANTVFTGGRLGINVDPANTFSYGSNISTTVGIVKTGGGTLVLSGNNTGLTGNATLSAGQLNIASATALGMGTFAVNGVASFDNTSGAPLTLTTNNPIIFSNNPTFQGSNDLNLGTGIATFTGARTITVRAHNLTVGPLSGTAALTKAGGGTLTINNATNAYTDTVINGGVLAMGNTGVLGSGDLTLGGGEINITGPSSGARTLTSGTLITNTGRDAVTLVADPTQPISFTASNLGNRANYSTPVFRGTNLGSTPANGVANIFFGTAPTVNQAGAGTVSGANSLAAADGAGALNTVNAAVLRGALVSTSATGDGTLLATYDPAVGVRALKPTEQTNAMTANANVKLSLSAGTTSFVGAVVNTLQLDNTSGSAAAATFSGSTGSLTAVNGFLFSGTSPISVTSQSSLTIGNGLSTPYDAVFLSTNPAGASINGSITLNNTGQNRGYTFGGPGAITINGNLLGVASQGGIAINGPGTVTLNGSITISSNGLMVTGGTLKFGPNFTLGTAAGNSRNFQLGAGGTVDMNGVSVGNVHGLSDFNGAGGVLTNSSATAATMTFAKGSDMTNPRTFTGLITGNLNLIWNHNVAGATGPQTLANTNSYTGFTTISSGTILLGLNNALPATTTLSINGGGTNPSALELQGFNQTIGALAGTATGGNGTLENSLINTTSNLTIAGAGDGTYSGVITDNPNINAIVSVTRSGTGTTTLAGNNSYTGGTNINGGLLRVNGSLSSKSNAVTVSGTGMLGGTGTIAGPVTVSGGHLAPGSGAVGALTLQNTFKVNAGTQFDYEFNGAANDQILASSVTNGFTLNGGAFNLLQEGTVNPFANPGTYNLVQFAGSIQGTGLDSSWTTGSTTNPHITDPQVFRSYQFGSSGGFLTLTITSTTTTATWSGTAGSNWNTAGAGGNWSGGAAPGSAGDSAIFPSNASSFTVALNGNKTLGALTLNSSTPYSITQGSSGTLFMDDSTSAATITDTNGSHSISAPVSLTSSTNVSVANATDTLTMSGNIAGTAMLIKGGAGTLVLSGSNSHGGTTINGGTISISADNNLGNSPTTINAGALATSTSMATARTLQVGSASSTIDVEGTANYELDGNIANAATAGTANKTGPGTLTINGNVTNTGGISVAAGTVQLGAGTVSGSFGTAPVNIGTLGNILINHSGATTISGNITGTGSLFVGNGQTLALAGNDAAYLGTLSVSNSTLSLASANPVGANVILTNSTLTQSVAGALYNGGVTSNSYSTMTIVGANTVDATGLALGISAALTGSGSLTHIGTGSVVLGQGLAGNTTFSNTFWGGTFTNSSGVVDIASRIAGSRNVAWHINGGSMVISESQGGSVELGLLDGPGPVVVTGNSARLRIGDLAGTDTYPGAISGASVGLAKFGNGTLILSGQNTFRNDGVTFSAGLSTGTQTDNGGYPVVVNSGTLVAAASTAGATGPLGGTPTYNPSAGSLALTGGAAVLLGAANQPVTAALVTSGAVTITNDITVSGGGATLSTGSYTLTLGGASDSASIFSGKVLLQNNLTVSQSATTGSNALNLTGGMFGVLGSIGPNDTTVFAEENTGFQTVTFAGAGRVNVTGMIADIDPNPTNYLGTKFAGSGGVVSIVSTGGTTKLTGADAYSGATTLAGGTLILGKNAQAPVLTGSGGGIINSGLLALDYSGGGTDPAATVQSILTAGNGNNFQSGQIRTTNAVNANRAIGYRDDTANSQVLIRNTFRGDANVDGVVNALDFNALATNFGTGSGKVWSQGDFNYSGAVDTSDFMFLAQNFGSVALPSTLPAPVLGSLVPEPSMLSGLAITAGLMARRRRRDRRGTNA